MRILVVDDDPGARLLAGTALEMAGFRVITAADGAIWLSGYSEGSPDDMALYGDLIVANGDAVNPDPTQPSEIVEFTKTGKFVGQFNVDAGQGGAFGIGIASVNFGTVRLVAVDQSSRLLDTHFHSFFRTSPRLTGGDFTSRLEATKFAVQEAAACGEPDAELLARTRAVLLEKFDATIVADQSLRAIRR